ncbi:MAG: DUF1176 domain-containing protein [Brevundimonas sp.]
MRLLTLIAGLALAACSAGDGAAAPAGQAGPDAEAATAAAGMPSETRTFRDWTAVCDNGNACFAFGPASEGVGWVRVALDAGPDARPSVMAGMWPGDDQGEADPLSLVIDGARFVTRSVPEADAPHGRIADEDALRVIAAMARGRAMSLSISIRDAGAPAEDVAVSLSGAAAALLWIDERQGRLNTTTALIRRGDRPASTVPAAPPLPRVTPAPAISQDGFGETGQTLPAALEALPAVKACRAETRDSDWASGAVMSARLDAATELWAAPCFLGAYNIGHEWFVTGPAGADPRPAVLVSASGEAGNATINGGYSPETRTLSAFAKGRGLGDCGTRSAWIWSGRAFVLTAEARMEDCQGVPADLWPSTWSTR